MQILNDISAILGLATQQGFSIQPVAITVSNQGSSIDMANFESATGAIIGFGAPLAAATTMQVQVEEWNGTTASGSTWTIIPNMVGAAVTTGPAQQLLLGLRTHRYVRVNANTFSVATTANVPVVGIVIGQPKSESQPSGYSRYPST